MASSDRDAIAQRAYEMYLAGGCEDGHAFDHWLAAEREVVRPPSRRD